MNGHRTTLPSMTKLSTFINTTQLKLIPLLSGEYMKRYIRKHQWVASLVLAIIAYQSGKLSKAALLALFREHAKHVRGILAILPKGYTLIMIALYLVHAITQTRIQYESGWLLRYVVNRQAYAFQDSLFFYSKLQMLSATLAPLEQLVKRKLKRQLKKNKREYAKKLMASYQCTPEVLSPLTQKIDSDDFIVAMMKAFDSIVKPFFHYCINTYCVIHVLGVTTPAYVFFYTFVSSYMLYYLQKAVRALWLYLDVHDDSSWLHSICRFLLGHPSDDFLRHSSLFNAIKLLVTRHFPQMISLLIIYCGIFLLDYRTALSGRPAMPKGSMIGSYRYAMALLLNQFTLSHSLIGSYFRIFELMDTTHKHLVL